jgi:hypothetical protein
MARSSLYDEDIMAWSEQQADALRRLVNRRDLPNELDLENVIEEVEDVGRSQLAAVESHLENILSHLAKAAVDPTSAALRHWRTEVVSWRRRLKRQITTSMRGKIDMDELWRGALQEAEAALDEYDRQDARRLLQRVAAQRPCPVTIDELCSSEFDFLAIAKRLECEFLANSQP